MDLESADLLLTTTRSVRRRLDLSKPVAREIVLDCLRVAVQAPSGSNAELWRWVVVTDPGVRRKLAEFYCNRPEDRRSALPRPPTTPQQDRVMGSVRYLEEHLHEVPVLVIPCIYRSGGAAGWAPSIYPAVWNFMLALRSRGLGSCLTTAHLYREKEAADLLGIPEDVAQACLLPVAYYTGHGFRAAERRPIEEITCWNRWDNLATSETVRPAEPG